MKIILASSSPRRKQILSEYFNDFEIIPPHINEDAKDGESPLEYCLRISREKAESTARICDDNCLIIACDTIVTVDGAIIGKPSSHKDAQNILRRLSGRPHDVISAVSLIYKITSGAISLTAHETTTVYFKKLSDAAINDYLTKIEYMDKAGAYAVQEFGGSIIEKIEGSTTNVIGFPVRLFFRMAGEINIADKLLS